MMDFFSVSLDKAFLMSETQSNNVIYQPSVEERRNGVTRLGYSNGVGYLYFVF